MPSLIRLPLIFAISALICTHSQAQMGIRVTTENSNNVVVLGTSSTYTLTGSPPGPVQKYDWQYRSSVGCTTGYKSFVSANDQVSVTVPESMPGTFQVQCVLTLGSGSPQPGQPPPPSSITAGPITVIVPPPDGIAILGAPSMTASLGQGARFTFIIQSGGINCGSYVSAFVGESITQYVNQGTPKTLKNPLWQRGDNVRLGMNGPVIYDTKQFNLRTAAGLAGWQRELNGFENSSYKQQFQISILDSCGNYKPYKISKIFNFTNVKASDNTVTFTFQ